MLAVTLHDFQVLSGFFFGPPVMCVRPFTPDIGSTARPSDPNQTWFVNCFEEMGVKLDIGCSIFTVSNNWNFSVICNNLIVFKNPRNKSLH